VIVPGGAPAAAAEAAEVDAAVTELINDVAANVERYAAMEIEQDIVVDAELEVL
jgi:hypothetical protein